MTTRAWPIWLGFSLLVGCSGGAPVESELVPSGKDDSIAEVVTLRHGTTSVFTLDCKLEAGCDANVSIDPRYVAPDEAAFDGAARGTVLPFAGATFLSPAGARLASACLHTDVNGYLSARLVACDDPAAGDAELISLDDQALRVALDALAPGKARIELQIPRVDPCGTSDDVRLAVSASWGLAPRAQD